MKILYYDCFAGISGDMNLAAMLDLGVSRDSLEAELKKLGLSGWHLEVSKAQKNGIWGTRVDVHCHSHKHEHEHENAEHCHCEHHHTHAHTHEHSENLHHTHEHTHHHEHRSFADIKKIIEDSGISQRAKNDALKIFETLAIAEAKVHGKSPDEVHFHEVGAIDSIIDIVGCAICLDILGVDEIRSSAVELGSGTVKCAHGVLPVPAPATAEIAKNFPSKINGASHECTTPTGAAIIATMAKSFESSTNGKIISCGIGVGHRDCAKLPNILRVTLFETSGESDFTSSRMCEICANIDDMSAEAQAHLCESLFKAGARDVWCEAIFMKKGRLGVKVSALCMLSEKEKIVQTFFKNSTTLGLRVSELDRLELARESKTISTSMGDVSFKLSSFGGKVRAKPEADDVAKIANERDMSFGEISDFAKDEFKREQS